MIKKNLWCRNCTTKFFLPKIKTHSLIIKPPSKKIKAWGAAAILKNKLP